MSDYQIKSKVSNKAADKISKIRIGAMLISGAGLIITGVCTHLLKMDIIEEPEMEVLYDEEYDDEYDDEYDTEQR